MWIIMTGTYAGNHGQFVKGVKYDLPADVIAELPKGSWNQTCAPWDEHKDLKAIKAADSLMHPAAVKQAGARDAEAAAKKAMKKAQRKGASDAVKRKAIGKSPQDKQFRPGKGGFNCKTKAV